jgi:uncharacterized protein YbjT (DUF2867 family)
MQKILVIGSTGKVGHALVQQLAQAGEHVRAATRNPVGITPSAGVEPTLFDYTDLSTFEPALTGVNRIFLMEPQPPLEGPAPQFMLPLVEAAARNQCKIVLMSSASAEFDQYEPLLEVEAAVKSTGRPFVILRPNWFMDNFHTMWLEPIVGAGIIPVPADGSCSAFIDSRDVAACAAAALRRDDINFHTFTLSGPEALTYYEAAAALTRASGRPISYVPIDDASFRQSLTDAGLPAEHVGYIAGLFGPTREGRAAEVSHAVQELTGRPPRTFAQYAGDHASAWK